jgi:hypothetical protein
MSWNEDELESGVLFAELEPGVEEERFFGCLGAPGHEYGGMGIELEGLSEELCLGVIWLAVDAVKFDGAGDVNSVGGDTESVESFSGGLGLSSDECESGEGGLEEEGGFAVASEAAFAEPSIDDGDGDLLLAALAEESRPEFEFHEDEEPGLDGLDGFANGPGKVEWEPDDLALG